MMLDLTLNIYIHCLILVTILSLFFVNVVSKMARRAIERELRHNLHTLVDKLDVSMIPSSVKEYISSVDLKIFDEDADATRVNNEWFLSVIKVIIGIFYLGLLFVLFVLRTSNVALPDLKEILKENLIIFTCIGAVEYMFFTNIALKFIPAPPSLIVSSFIDNLKNVI